MNRKGISKLFLSTLLTLTAVPCIVQGYNFSRFKVYRTRIASTIQRIKQNKLAYYGAYYVGNKTLECIAFVALARYRPDLVARAARYTQGKIPLLRRTFAPNGIQNPYFNRFVRKCDKKLSRMNTKYTHKYRTKKINHGKKNGTVVSDLSKCYNPDGGSSIQPFSKAQQRRKLFEQLGHETWSPIFNGPTFSPRLKKEILV